MATDPATVLAAMSAGLKVVNAAAEVLGLLNQGHPLTDEQINRIQADKIAADNRWAQALHELRKQAGTP